jgi:hypothetical protein
MPTTMCTARHATVAITAALLTLTACSGSEDEDDKSDDAPSLAPSEEDTAPPADDDAEIEAAIAAYDKALVTVNREHEVTPELSAVATDTWADQLVTTYDDNLFSNGLEMVGRWRTKVSSVTVDGDSAQAEVCSDGTKVYVVEGGGPVPSGASNQGRAPATVSLVREDEGWQIDGNATEEGRC